MDMFKRALGLATLAACILAVSGCETMGGSQTETTIYDMHRRIVKLDKDLGDSITKLNETAASLNARVEGMDQQTRSLNTTIEDSNAKLNELAKEFNRFKADYYRLNGLTPGQTSTPGTNPNIKIGAPGIETATGSVVPPPAAAIPAQTPVGGTAAAPAASGQNELTGSAPLPTGEKAAPIAAPAVPQPADEPPPVAAPAAAGDPRVLYQQAQKSYSNNDWGNAQKQFDDYLKQYPNSDQSANALFWKAKCLLNTEKYADAVKSFESMRSTYPTSSKIPFAMHNQAVAYSRLGQSAEAERLMQAVIDQYPMSPVAEQAKSDLKRLQGKQ
jgi:tol-pal system protein YbgF